MSDEPRVPAHRRRDRQPALPVADAARSATTSCASGSRRSARTSSRPASAPRCRSCSPRSRTPSRASAATSRWSSARPSSRSPTASSPRSRRSAVPTRSREIVREVGRVASRRGDGAGAAARDRGARDGGGDRDRRLGRVDGCCLTAVALADGRDRLRRRAGDARAHLARAARRRRRASTSSRRCGPASRSAATTSRVTSTASAPCAASRTEGEGRRVWFDARRELLRYVVEKGSIAVEGTSLTVAALDDARLRGRADPAHARRDDARRARAPATRSTSRSTCSRSTSSGCCSGPAASLCRMAITTPFAAIEEAIEEIRDGRFVVVVDDPDRENEGDLVIAAQFATPETINFMATHARGLICLCLTEERADQLGLRPMTERNEAPLGTAFTVSIEAREGVDDRDLRRRPQPHDPGRDRARHRAVRPRPAGARLPAARQAGRRARADRPDRGGGRPRPARRPQPVRRRLRDHERGRDDGARARPDPLLRAARAEDDHRRRSRRVPPPAREARRARRVGAAADRATASSPRSPSARR